jgi:glycerol-3-phosphate dehydrogenase
VCDWGDDGEGSAKLEGILQHSLEAGDNDDEILTASETLALEPNINKSVKASLHIKNEVVVDPWLIPMSYASHAVENGATIKTSWRVEVATFNGEVRVWRTLADEQMDGRLGWIVAAAIRLMLRNIH